MDFERDYEIYDKSDKEKEDQLIQNILKTQNDLSKAHRNFNYAEDDLIDFYVYEIKALQAKLDYLTRIAKMNNIDYSFYTEQAG